MGQVRLSGSLAVPQGASGVVFVVARSAAEAADQVSGSERRDRVRVERGTAGRLIRRAERDRLSGNGNHFQQPARRGGEPRYAIPHDLVQINARRTTRDRLQTLSRPEVLGEFQPVASELLLEQRIDHDSGRAGVFHAFDVFDFLRKRRGRGHERRAEFEAEISGAEVHSVFTG